MFGVNACLPSEISQTLSHLWIYPEGVFEHDRTVHSFSSLVIVWDIALKLVGSSGSNKGKGRNEGGEGTAVSHLAVGRTEIRLSSFFSADR